MARRGTLAKLLTLCMLNLGALMGMPMRPEDIEALMRTMHGTTIEHIQEEEDDGDPP